jgi:pimeloyl-ACP methyl ester carboxylesterase
LRLVAPDRPGLGGSDPLPGRHLLDWAGDAGQLADALGWGHFPVIGVSGGGPFALACAAGLPGRLTRVAVVAGMAPPDAPEGTRGMRWIGRLELFLARYWPAAARPPLRWAVRATLNHPWGLPEWVSGSMPEADRRTMARPEVAKLFRSSVRESVRQGYAGVMQELSLLAHPWGFRLDRVATPVTVWHGEADITVPVSMGRYTASQLPRCRAAFYPEDGHFSLPINHAWPILTDLKNA